jgi:NTE family protein
MKKIAIACQGGGSHCAFTGGVLAALLRRVHVDAQGRLVLDGHEIVGLSGTSGGAVGAYLAWLDLLRLRHGLPLPEGEPLAVERFWRQTAAQPFGRFPYDMLTNLAMVGIASMDGKLPTLTASPNAATRAIQAHLRTQIEQSAGDLSFLQPLLQAEGGLHRARVRGLAPEPGNFPVLVVGATNVNHGLFEPFMATPSHPPLLDQIVAATALPDLFPSLGISSPMKTPRHGEDGSGTGAEADALHRPATPAHGPEPATAHYWDGLMSQNPPISDFLGFDDCAVKPDEVWIVRINPVARRNGAGRIAIEPPTRGTEIADRRNELAGNLSLEQEKRFVRRLNAMHDGNALSAQGRERYKKVALWGIALDGWADVPEHPGAPDGDWREVKLKTPRMHTAVLDYATKLLRSPAFLAELDALGREAALEFLAFRCGEAPPPVPGVGGRLSAS